MNIRSEQEMIDFGTAIANDLNIAFRDISRSPLGTRMAEGQPTGSELARSPVTTGATKRVEKSDIKSFCNVIELIGDVGAGKTTFVRGLAKGLGIKEPITSPSFTISKSYAFKDKEGKEKNLIHYDFYRLSNPGLMADDLADSINNPDNLIVVEWADSISGILPENRLKITINYNEDNTREVTIS